MKNEKTILDQEPMTRMNFTTIQKGAEEAIDYFTFKTKYAKNKPYHTKQLNKLIRLNNAFEFILSGEIFKVIESLSLALLRHKLKETANMPFAISYVAELMKFPQYSKGDTVLWINDTILQQRMSETPLTTDNVLQIIDFGNTDKLVDEISIIFKQSVSWE